MRTVNWLLTIVAMISCAALALCAEDAPPTKQGSAKGEFEKVQAEFNTINADLRSLQVEYRRAAKEDRPALEKKWAEAFRKAEEMQTKYFKAAEAAFTEAPNADPDLTRLAWRIFSYEMGNDDYDRAAPLVKVLIQSGGAKDQTYAAAGVAAVAAGDFKAAADYLAKAKAAGVLRVGPDLKDKVIENAYVFSQNLAALEANWEKEQKIREAEAKADDLPLVLIKTNKGDIVVELFENEAPNTVANFITLVEKKFYDGLTFHRVLPGFMAQGGDPKGDGNGGPGYTIPDEVSDPEHRLHFRGSLSMAKTGAPNSGGSQFFLCFLPTPFLDGKHTVFGRIISGFDVLAKINRRDPTDANAADPDKIIEMKVLRKRDHEYTVKKTGEPQTPSIQPE
jgi:cyclophilin family peptidyl-prolyl cis-trans isomerase